MEASYEPLLFSPEPVPVQDFSTVNPQKIGPAAWRDDWNGPHPRYGIEMAVVIRFGIDISWGSYPFRRPPPRNGEFWRVYTQLNLDVPDWGSNGTRIYNLQCQDPSRSGCKV